MYSLVLDYVSVAVGGHGDAELGEAVGSSAAPAGKMRVALIGRAVMRQFKIPRAILHIRLVDDVGGDEGLQRTVNRYLVGGVGADSLCDLFARQRLVRFEKRREYIRPRFCPAKSGGFEHLLGLVFRLAFHQDCSPPSHSSVCSCVCGWLWRA